MQLNLFALALVGSIQCRRIFNPSKPDQKHIFVSRETKITKSRWLPWINFFDKVDIIIEVWYEEEHLGACVFFGDECHLRQGFTVTMDPSYNVEITKGKDSVKRNFSGDTNGRLMIEWPGTSTTVQNKTMSN